MIGNSLQNFTEKQRRVLTAIVENLSEGLTETELSQKAGVSRQHLWSLRKQPEFQLALREAVREELMGKVDFAARKLLEKVEQGNVRCLLALLELTGLYAPIQRTQSMNVNYQVDRKALGEMLPKDAQKEVVRQWGLLGWSREDFDELWQTAQEDTSPKVSRR